MSLFKQLENMKISEIIYTLQLPKSITTVTSRKLRDRQYVTEVCFVISNKGIQRENLTRVQRIK